MKVVRTWKTPVCGDLAGSPQSEENHKLISLRCEATLPPGGLLCALRGQAAACWAQGGSGDSSRGEGSCGRCPGPRRLHSRADLPERFGLLLEAEMGDSHSP